MKTYTIKPIQWNVISHSLCQEFVRENSPVYGYYSYSIFRYRSYKGNSNGEWSPYYLDIRLDDRTFYPKQGRNIRMTFDNIEDAKAAANKHHNEFVESFLEELT